MRVYTFPNVQRQVYEAVRLWENGLTRIQIGEKIGKSPALISLYLKSAGVNMRERRHSKYDLNTKFFNKINSHKKAYWLGFVLADGHITKNGSTLVIELQTRDRYHLETFVKDVSFTGFLRDTKHKSIRKGIAKIYRGIRLDLCSQEMTSALLAAGWNEFKMEGGLRIVESVPKKLMPSLMRGLFDGDGSLALYKNQLFFSFTDKYRSVTEWYQDVLIQKLGLSKITVRPAKRKCAWTFRYGGNIQVRRILEWLGSTSGPRLARKTINYHDRLH